MLDPVPLAWASGLGLCVGVTGTLISLIGLVLTFREARRAKHAALAAQSAVARIVALTRSRTRLAALSSAVSQADAIGVRIQKDGLRDGRELFTSFRRVVKEAIATVAILDGRGPHIGEVDHALEEIARLIGANVEERAREAQMIGALNRISDFLIHEEARAKTEDLA